MAEFVVSSTSFAPGGPWAEKHYWNQFGCTGGNVSPALQWSGAPGRHQELRNHRCALTHPPAAAVWH